MTPGEVLTVNVGGRGVTGDLAGNGGFNGGADGPAGGGGASDVRRSASPGPQRLVVAGGGGGFGGGARFGQPIFGFAGGAGGGPVGTGGGGDSVVPGGGGGTQTSGGAGGASFFVASPGQPGSSGTGGFPGGGGGYFGGGGGATFDGESQQASGAGGGGSGFGPPGCTSGCGPATVFETGVRSGNGLVTISYENSPPSAKAGEDRIVNRNTAFTLDASQSTDANGDPLRYRWQQVGGSPVAVIRDPDERTPEAQVDGISARADLTFRVTVTDVHGDSTTDDVLIHVK